MARTGELGSRSPSCRLSAGNANATRHCRGIDVDTHQQLNLDDQLASDAGLTGAKAANLARARAAGLPTLPGVVLTTAWSPGAVDDALEAWRSVSDGGARAVVVRSSST